jgi:cell division protein FtsI (penicillin-binding protein 3)
VGSFAGFAPINNPAIVVAVILDSAVGLHQGGQVAAPVFQRVTQQVLEYLHTPHDVELPPNRQVLLAQRKVKDQDLEEGSPDHLGESIELADAGIPDTTGMPAVAAAKPSPEIVANGVVPASLRERKPIQASASTQPPPAAGETTSDNTSAVPASRSNGTVVLDVEQGGIVVPSFVGKSVRAAIEMAQEFGLDLEAVGSGVARVQSPAPGAHVAAGARVTVRFER